MIEKKRKGFVEKDLFNPLDNESEYYRECYGIREFERRRQNNG